MDTFRLLQRRTWRTSKRRFPAFPGPFFSVFQERVQEDMSTIPEWGSHPVKLRIYSCEPFCGENRIWRRRMAGCHVIMLELGELRELPSRTWFCTVIVSFLDFRIYCREIKSWIGEGFCGKRPQLYRRSLILLQSGLIRHSSIPNDCS